MLLGGKYVLVGGKYVLPGGRYLFDVDGDATLLYSNPGDVVPRNTDGRNVSFELLPPPYVSVIAVGRLFINCPALFDEGNGKPKGLLDSTEPGPVA